MAKTERRIVQLPEGLWAEIESYVGKRKVSEFIARAADEALTHHRAKAALAARVAELEGRDGAEK